MSDEPGDGLIEVHPEEGGGPVKPFLDHLEDLRWTLVRCVVAVVLGMLLCMVAADRVIGILTWPLKRSNVDADASGTNRLVGVYLGTNFLGKVRAPSFPMVQSEGTPPRHFESLRLNPILIGTNVVVGMDWNSSPVVGGSSLAVTLKNYSPMGALMVMFQVAFFGGVVLSCPFVLYFLGHYILPALHLHEKNLVLQVAAMGTFLFLLGVAFCYFILLQVALMASVQMSQWMGFGADEWRAEEYLSFVCKFLLALGVSFELPVVILILVRIGLLDYKKLAAFRSYWVVLNLVICAVLTPSGDPLTMFIMAAPLHLLYEISVMVAYFWHKKDLKASQDQV